MFSLTKDSTPVSDVIYSHTVYGDVVFLSAGKTNEEEEEVYLTWLA